MSSTKMSSDFSDQEIISRARADTDYTIAYIEGEPVAVVEEDGGGYYGALADGEYVENAYEGFWWYVKDGQWHSTPVQSNALINIMDGYSLRDINDGNQTVYDGVFAK